MSPLPLPCVIRPTPSHKLPLEELGTQNSHRNKHKNLTLDLLLAPRNPLMCTHVLSLTSYANPRRLLFLVPRFAPLVFPTPQFVSSLFSRAPRMFDRAFVYHLVRVCCSPIYAVVALVPVRSQSPVKVVSRVHIYIYISSSGCGIYPLLQDYYIRWESLH